jgi:hypothetical protein
MFSRANIIHFDKTETKKVSFFDKTETKKVSFFDKTETKKTLLFDKTETNYTSLEKLQLYQLKYVPQKSMFFRPNPWFLIYIWTKFV